MAGSVTVCLCSPSRRDRPGRPGTVDRGRPQPGCCAEPGTPSLAFHRPRARGLLRAWASGDPAQSALRNAGKRWSRKKTSLMGFFLMRKKGQEGKHCETVCIIKGQATTNRVMGRRRGSAASRGGCRRRPPATPPGPGATPRVLKVHTAGIRPSEGPGAPGFHSGCGCASGVSRQDVRAHHFVYCLGFQWLELSFPAVQPEL